MYFLIALLSPRSWTIFLYCSNKKREFDVNLSFKMNTKMNLIVGHVCYLFCVKLKSDNKNKKIKFEEISNSDKEVRELTPARRWWREGSRGGSISSNNGRLTEQVRSVLWKLAYKQLAPEDWKKLASHWAFTPEQIRAIEHQYTGKSILFIRISL